jgi:hypothetical protein
MECALVTCTAFRHCSSTGVLRSVAPALINLITHLEPLCLITSACNMAPMQTLVQRAQAGLSSAAHTRIAPAAFRQFSSGPSHSFRVIDSCRLQTCHSTLGSSRGDKHAGVVSRHSSSLMHSSSSSCEISVRSYASASLSASTTQLEGGRTDAPATELRTSARLNAETLELRQLCCLMKVSMAAMACAPCWCVLRLVAVYCCNAYIGKHLQVAGMPRLSLYR